MIDGLKPYPAYKDSGLPWLGEIPGHWSEKRAKYFYREVDERSTTGGEQLLSVSHITGVTPRKQNVTMFMAETNVGHKIARPGDLVINTMWAWMVALGVARQTGVVSPSYGVYRPRPANGLLPDYVDRLLRTRSYSAEYLCRSTGIRASRLRLYPEHFLRIPILAPPPDEQAAIVRFLDHADRLVRRYIRAKKKLIALLNEQKQAIIDQAVTRGLNPNVRLKPSGVERLGDAPEHWQVVRLAQLITDGPRNGISPAVAEGESCTRSFSISAIREGHVDVQDTDIKLVRNVGNERSSTYDLRAGDILLVRGNGNIKLVGKAGLVNRDMPEFVYPDLLMRIRLSAEACPGYVARVLNSAVIRNQIESVTKTAVGTFKINNQHVRQFWVSLPPYDEQAAILRHIEDIMKGPNTAVAQTERAIALFNEYRTRLIADIATGKLDVREAAARLPDEPAEPEAIEEPEGSDEIDEEPEGTDLEEEAAA